jgi:hypothetical protein
MQPHTPPLRHNPEQQSASDAHALLSGEQSAGVHMPLAHAPPPQSMPQPPQLCASLTRFEQTPLPQSTSAGFVQPFDDPGDDPGDDPLLSPLSHFPAAHDCPTTHVCPHPPQL